MTPLTFFDRDRGQRVPIHAWKRELAPATLRQLQQIASQPWVVGHVAAMPDAHVAEGVAVGTVFATERELIPTALGGDLGCGMSALRFDLSASSLGTRELSSLLGSLGRLIPVGDATHQGRGVSLPDSLLDIAASNGAVAHALERTGPRHLGTLGGGNHFVELDRDAGGSLWALLHTGSRGIGAAVHAHHRKAAGVDERTPLAALDVTSETGAAYLADLSLAYAFARANRDRILAKICEVIVDATGAAPDLASSVDIHHNFVTREHHLGRDLLVHRKGAVRADVGVRAIIPGSMGTASYLVEGKGEPLSFCSCSHGAGRVMTRAEARDQIRPDALERALRRVVFDRRMMRRLVEEAPAVYRDIREVLDDEDDLVTPFLRLEPIAVLKG